MCQRVFAEGPLGQGVQPVKTVFSNTEKTRLVFGLKARVFYNGFIALYINCKRYRGVEGRWVTIACHCHGRNSQFHRNMHNSG